MTLLETLATQAREAGPETIPDGRTMTLHDDKFHIEFPYEAGLVDGIRSVPGADFKKATKKRPTARWEVPISSAPALHQFAETYKFDGAECIENAKQLVAAAVEASAATDADIEIDGLTGTLMPYQKAGVAYILAHRRTLLGDEMGLGKTIQAIAAMKAAGIDRYVIVCPATLKRNWAREIDAWVPGTDVAIIEGTKPNPAAYQAAVVIINYDILAHHVDALIEAGFRGKIADESHYIKNPKAQRTKAEMKLAKSIPADGLMLLLTGTPIVNRPVELAAQLRVLGLLDSVFGGYWQYVRRYCNAYRTQFGWDVSGASNLPELHERLRSCGYVRRLKSQVLKDLPPKTRRRVILDLTDEQMREYRDAEADVLQWLREQAREAMDAAGNDPDAQQAAYHQWLKANSNGAEHLRRVGVLRRLSGEAKVPAIIDWTNAFLEGSERKLVLFAHHVSIIDQYMEAFGEQAVRVSGNVSMADRDAAVQRFQTDPTCRVFVGNLKAAGVGITLHAASDVFMAERDWTPGGEGQAEDRCHRIGQEDHVTAWYGFLPETIDADMDELIEDKRMVVDLATDGIQVGDTGKMPGDIRGELFERLASQALTGV